MRIRLDRWLTALALASRSEGKVLIRRGAVTVNGRTVLDPGAVFETEEAHLALGGRPIDGRTERHVMMNKPSGLLTAARDRKQPTVMDLLPPSYASLGCMPAGRLDKDTTGILFLTTDGELNHRLLSPGRHVDKVYRARVSGRLTEADVRAFAAGLALSDFTAMPAELLILEAGDAESLFKLGRYYEKGLFVNRDDEQALRCYRDAAEAGYAQAWVYLGRLYDAGVIVKPDAVFALECYRKAADMGSAQAYWYLGSFYEEGTGVEQNYGMAMDYYQMAADRGDADSWMSLAYMWLQGKGVEADQQKALEYYEKAASLGSSLACDYLGYLYMTGTLVTRDTAKGIEWYEKAAGLGNARSMYALGYAYQCGQGVAISMDEALKWYEKAALAGHKNAYLVWKAYRK